MFSSTVWRDLNTANTLPGGRRVHSRHAVIAADPVYGQQMETEEYMRLLDKLTDI